jgi:hypothetical protein
LIDCIKKVQGWPPSPARLGNGTWGYIVGTYDKDAGPDNQRLYLNGTRVARMSDTLPIDLTQLPLASDGM